MVHTRPAGMGSLRFSSGEVRAIPIGSTPAGSVTDNLAGMWLRSARQTGAGRVQADSNPDTATAQTVAVMVDQARSSARDPGVMRAAVDAVRRFRGGPLYQGDARSPLAQALSCWWWAKTCIRFVHHEALIRQWLHEGDQLQLLISPDVLVRMEDKRGDCAIFTELICSFLTVLGLRWEIVTAAVDPREPGVYSHVYPRAVLPDGSRCALDASHGKYPGWQVPTAHIMRCQVWDMEGRPVADEDPRWSGLHDYRRGLGDDATGTPYTDVGPNTTTLSDPYGWYSAGGGGTSTPVAPAGAPAAPGFNWGNLFGGLATQWSTIGGRILAPTTTIQRGPNGQLLITTPNAPGAATVAAGGSSFATGTGGISSGVILLAVAAVAALMFMGGKK